MRKNPKTLAIKNIDILFERAREAYGKGIKDHADRYVEIALAISTRNRVSLKKDHKFRFCKRCGSYLGKDNLRIRTNNGKLVYLCLDCKSFRRIPYKFSTPKKTP